MSFHSPDKRLGIIHFVKSFLLFHENIIMRKTSGVCKSLRIGQMAGVKSPLAP
ncbi:hypothetical protein HMPREF3038_02890 [Akkermansia sp. KLE1797]|nr:hypothetical protein HMPREF3038_02890 [Akkermansia sp. KLE1797]KXU52640.1 hypothetical protein HMPREF3039_03164 [Akkermansia sp. KLE1798]KZA04070.1 hypothetical protein HMPREF1326_02267 [Akkermansia sp. KLE1605]